MKISVKNLVKLIIILLFLIIFIHKKEQDLTNIIILDERIKINRNEVTEIIKYLDNYALYSKSDNWLTERSSILEKLNFTTDYNEILKLLNDAIFLCGGKHSTLIVGDIDDKTILNKKESLILPQTSFKDDILYISLPTCINLNPSLFETKEYFAKYSNLISRQILDHSEMNGVVLDMRNNSGGSIYPLLGGLSPLLPEGVLFYSLDNAKNKTSLILKDNQLWIDSLGSERKTMSDDIFSGINYYSITLDKPIAVIIDKTTASAAEIVLLAFKDLNNVKFFGSKTRGLTSGNDTFYISNKLELNLTVGIFQTNSGDIYENKPIFPHVYTSNVEESAYKWIDEYNN